MPINSIKIDAAWKKAILVLAAAACITAAWFSARWGMANSAAMRSNETDVALYLTQLAPDDPQTHHAAAVLLEKSFDPEDIRRALYELELAAALSPENYVIWLDLGRARERSGDVEGAEKAFRRAVSLAPNYARVQWVLGNALVRQGRLDEGFAEIRKAATNDDTFVRPTLTLAMQLFDGDLTQVGAMIGDTPALTTALPLALAESKRYDEAFRSFEMLPSSEEKTASDTFGKKLSELFAQAKKFRYAAVLAGGENSSVGKITNGSFEETLKTDGAGIFEWQISSGLQPQIVISSGQKHSGGNSLLLVFNSTSGADFRTVSQMIAVEPSAEYELAVYYRSDLKSMAVFKWEVVDASDGKPLAATDASAAKSEWAPLRGRFRTPATSDGVIVRLSREGCGRVCNVSGSIWFDDLTLSSAAK